ncbi:MAG: biotin transporter BioY [Nocardioides sp.]
MSAAAYPVRSARTALVPALVRPDARVAGLLVDAALVVVGVVLVALSAQVSIPLGFTPVPVTGQTFAALLVGGAYGAGRGLTTMAAYLLVGGLGAPVFAEHASGWGILSAPTAGYLAGMLLAAGVVGWAAEHGWDRRLTTSLVAMVVGSVVIYALGLLWLGHALGTSFHDTWVLGAQPFLLGDTLKLALAAGVLPSAWKLVATVRR